MKITKHGQFPYNLWGVEYDVYILFLNNDVIYLAHNQDIGIQQLTPRHKGILDINPDFFWLDKSNWLVSQHNQAKVGITKGQDYVIHEIKVGLLDYWRNRPK